MRDAVSCTAPRIVICDLTSENQCIASTGTVPVEGPVLRRAIVFDDSTSCDQALSNGVVVPLEFLVGRMVLSEGLKQFIDANFAKAWLGSTDPDIAPNIEDALVTTHNCIYRALQVGRVLQELR